VRYVLTDAVQQGAVSPSAVTFGIATIIEAREVVDLRCLIVADRDALGYGGGP
jgi:hypothetical protein